MTAAITRRRSLLILAGAAGTLLAMRAGRAAAPVYRWRGVALGADAHIVLQHEDAAAARALIAAATQEIARLEAVFSLYRADSALSQLNRDGALPAPPPELVELLAHSRDAALATGGAFDPTVQPLWRLYADHFAKPGADPAGPPPEAIAAALTLVDHHAIAIDTARLALTRPGMALTLNGIAQGYITDRVAALLRRAGLADVLLDLGEIAALGHRPEGGPWRVALADRNGPRLALSDRAVATSSGAATRFDPAGRYHHLFDPHTGRSTARYAAVSVVAQRAATADALSTAVSAMPEPAVPPALAALGAEAAFVRHRDGGWGRIAPA